METNIRITKFLWLPALKSIWKSLYNSSSLSVFQSYEFSYSLWLNYPVYLLTCREIPIFYLIEDNETPVVIAPLCKKANGSYEIFGNKNGFEYCDFIYTKFTPIDRYIPMLINALKSDITFHRVRETSALFDAFSKSSISEFSKIGDVININIPIPESHESYFKSLSSSVRQNLRTSYNRLTRDNRTLEISFLFGTNKLVHKGGTFNSLGFDQTNTIEEFVTKGKKKDLLNQMLSLYAHRHEMRYGVKTSILKQFYLRHFSFVSNCQLELPEAISVMLYIDEKLCAFMSGFTTQNGNEFVIPRLSINNDFLFYSPGNILINETIRLLIEYTSIRNLDLSQGNEQYKYRMGGVEHLTKSFVWHCNI